MSGLIHASEGPQFRPILVLRISEEKIGIDKIIQVSSQKGYAKKTKIKKYKIGKSFELFTNPD